MKANELKMITKQAIKEREEKVLKACETLYTETIEPELVRTAKLGCNAHTFKKELFKVVPIDTMIEYFAKLGFQVKSRDYSLTIYW
jgi:hypothetical protein